VPARWAGRQTGFRELRLQVEDYISRDIVHGHYGQGDIYWGQSTGTRVRGTISQGTICK